MSRSEPTVRRLLPLRVTLVAAVLVLVAVGLVASAFAVTSALRTSLTDRVDEQLSSAVHGWARPRGAQLPTPPDAPGPGRPPTPFYVHTVAADGEVLREINDETETSGPQLPSSPATRPTTVPGRDGGPDWRIRSITASDGTVTTVGMSLAQNEQTLRRLEGLQFGIGLGVLVAVGAVGYVVVRRSLAPLRKVEATASAIAAGDLDRRVPQWDSRSEVGQLTEALNAMLGQIQTAFAQSEASEADARRSEERMRRFVADAGHELRTPLTSISGFAQLAEQGAVPADEAIGRIDGEAERMKVLVEDLMMLARLDAERPVEHDAVDVLAVASDAVHAARAQAPERSISLLVESGSGTYEVSGDAQRLRQVFGNLLTNAIVHTPADADIVVRLSAAGDEVAIEVADTGPGMSADEAAHVFDRFYRAEASRSRASGGAGLGLSIVASLVAAMGGTVAVASAPGEGATFRVTLPRRPE